MCSPDVSSSVRNVDRYKMNRRIHPGETDGVRCAFDTSRISTEE
jgi:hypothetical protein